MTTRDKIQSYCDGEPTLLLEPEMFDSAIIGIAERCGQPPLVAYDRDRCIQIIMAGCWAGDGTPVFIDTRYAE